MCLLKRLLEVEMFEEDKGLFGKHGASAKSLGA